MLFRLLKVLQLTNSVKKSDLEEFKKLNFAAHYTALANASIKAGLKELAAMQLSSVLRYVGLVPADRAFYEAGMAWKNAGKPSLAFVMLNRFLDLSDAMDDPDSAGDLENADFAETDIPFDFHIPQRPFANEDMKEDVRNFVLELSMDQQARERACRVVP